MKIHPTAIIHKGAEVARDVEIGPYSIIGENVTMGRGTVIGPSCVIEGRTTIGENCRAFTGAIIGSIPQDLKYKGERSYLKIGNNNIIREYVTINHGTGEGGETIIGDGNLLMAYAHVAHDCKVGSRVIIANAGTLAGHVSIGDKSIVGGLAAIHQFVRVGMLAIIGGCSKVVQDVPPYSTVDGHPTKVYGLNSIGLKRSGIPHESVSSLKHAFRILFHSGLSLSTAFERIDSEIEKCPELSILIDFMKTSKRGVGR